MNHQQIIAALGGRTAAVDQLTDIYSDIIGAEKSYLKEAENPKEFTKAADEVFRFDDQSRSWGDSYFDGRSIDEIETLPDGVCIRYSDQRPCGRGCCYDSVYDDLTIPASLIDAHGGAAYEEALRRFTQERVEKVRQHMAAEAENARAKKEAQEFAREEKERAEFLRLQAKYGEN